MGTYVGEVAGYPIFKEETANYVGNYGNTDIPTYMQSNGDISILTSDNQWYTVGTSQAQVQDTDSGWLGSLSSLLDSVGGVANQVTGIFNQVSSAYTQATGASLINTSSSNLKNNGLSESDMNKVENILNSAINKVKKYGVYAGAIVVAIIVASLIYKNKKAKAK